VPKEVRQLIRTMSRENPLWGAPRIYGELLSWVFLFYVDTHREVVDIGPSWPYSIRTEEGTLRRYLEVAVAIFLSGSVMFAAPITFTGVFSGANENPATGSPGTGTAMVTLDQSTHSLVVDVVFSNLFTTTPTGGPSGTTAAHIHCCIAPPGNAGVATTVPTFPGFPLGVTSSTYQDSFDLLSADSYNRFSLWLTGGPQPLPMGCSRVGC
jgi:hypothetical protein